MLFHILNLLVLIHWAIALPSGIKFANPHATDVIPNEYIIVLKSSLTASQIEQHKSRINAIHSLGKLSGIEFNYTMPTLKGYSGKFDDSTLQAIAKSPEVSLTGSSHDHSHD